MLSESSRVTTAHEAAFRVQYPNSKPRAVKIIALDAQSAAVVDELARAPWGGATFFTALNFSAEGAPGDATGRTLQAWLSDLRGRALDLVAEVASADFVVVITTAGADARSVSVIADACKAHHKSLVGVVVPGERADDDAVTASLKQLRPYAKMLVVANAPDYVEAMLSALRA